MVVHTSAPVILASASVVRGALLRQAGVEFRVVPARVDEPAIRDALAAEGARPREVADALAAHKAQRISARYPEAVVVGCDQVLDLDGEVLGKPDGIADARVQLMRLRARSHLLHSAAVICRDGVAEWRHIGQARLTMQNCSDSLLDDYLARNWPEVSDSVGGYKIEGEGVRLFARIEGSHFTILGLPLLELLGYLGERGVIAT